MEKYDRGDHERFKKDCEKIHEFIRSDGKIDEVRAVINNDPELGEYLATNDRVPNFYPPLYRAAWHGNLKMIRLLIEEFNHCIDVKGQYYGLLPTVPHRGS